MVWIVFSQAVMDCPQSSGWQGRVSRFAVFAAQLLTLFVMLGAMNVYAATCTSRATGNWSAAATWSCIGLPFATIPGVADAVIIANLSLAHVVTVNVNSAAASVTFIRGSRGSTLQISPGVSLNVAGAITLNPSTSRNAARQKRLNVGSGSLSAASIHIVGGSSARRTARLRVSTGTITSIGSITFSGTARGARLISTGASTINIGGDLSSGGSLVTSNTGTINFNGSVATQSIGMYSSYNNVTIANTNIGGVVSLQGATSMSGTLSVISGTLDKSMFALDVAGNLTVNSAITGSIGALTLSGVGTWIDGTGSISTTDALTISASKSILSTANLTITSPISIVGSSIVTNTGTVHSVSSSGISGSEVGATWINSANSTLNVTGPLLLIGTLNAVANPNTVNYAGISPTVKASSYYHLSLGGTGEATLGTGTTIVGGMLTIGANNLNSGTNTLTLLPDCSANSGNGSLSRSSGYVIGNLQLTFPSFASTCIFPVGDSIAYAPVTVVLASSAGGTLTARVDAGDHPDTNSSASGIDFAKSANHFWALTAGTLSLSATYSATFQFCANTSLCTVSEVDAGANTGNFNVALKSAGIWAAQTVGARTNYATEATGISGFGEFSIGEISTNNCFLDTFTGVDNSSPGSNWLVGNAVGTFGNPVIFGNRLRLSDASQNVGTWATLQRLMPAAGNKITVEFDHFSYGGTHADGIALIFSDASVSPLVGAFGGSLGYAQKGYTPVSDCTIVGGCPGFAGGWLGVGIDEYGNYSTSNEGRYDGSTILVPHAVAIRGSGSGVSGYRFLQGTSTLTPAIDSATVLTPPHRYRVVLDHTDGVHVWTSVERDVSGGGSAYVTLIGCPPEATSGCMAFDIKDPGYSQDAVPANFNLSFTGATGALTNIHEIDNLKVCTVQGLVSPVLHHIQLEHGGAACINTPEAVTVKACADAACTSLYLGSVTVNLSTSGGTWLPSSAITFTGGQATVTLTDTAVRSDTLGATATSPSAAYTTLCFNGTTQTCVLTFSSCAFDVVEVGAPPNTPIFTKLAAVPYNLNVVFLNRGRRTVTAVELVDADSGTCSTYAALANTSTTLPVSFNNNQRRIFSFSYPNAAPNVRVRVRTSTSSYSCSSDNFAIRPLSFTVTSNASQTGSSGTPVFRAGRDVFSLIVTTATNAYSGVPKLNSSLVGTSLANLGTLVAVLFPPAVNGISSASGFTYFEVGNFVLSQYAVYDDTYTKVDAIKGECTPDFNNGPEVGGKFGCMFGSVGAGPFGRFVPDHFVSLAGLSNACAMGSFSYMDQPFALTSADILEATNATNGVTRNYAPPYAPGVLSFAAENADNGIDLIARFNLPTGSWNQGVFTLASTSGRFVRPVSTLADATWGPFDALDLGLKVADNDVITSPAISGADMNPNVAGGNSFDYKKLAGGPLRMRFGRLKLENAHGSELINLPITAQTQYWNGVGFVRNTDDNCTNLSASNIAFNVALGGVSPSVGGVFSSGLGSLILNKPNPSIRGFVDMCIDLGVDPLGGTTCSASISANLPYLKGLWSPGNSYNNDPVARATFGVYKGNTEFIYLREAY